jgi:FKBP-type peptidyl-prolyl cis-trans isomerase FkpA
MSVPPRFRYLFCPDLYAIGVVSVSIALAGCQSASKLKNAFASSKPTADPASVAATDPPGDAANPSSLMLASAAAPSKAVTFTDKPELQQGTGAIDADAPTEFQKTESGLRYRILRKSGGPKPKLSDTVTVKYRGWLSNGKVFDSSYDRGQPTSFPLTGVIAGWTEGMQLIGVGGMIELWVPSKLGYGAGGSPGSVPPHSTLHFVVELMQVK